MKKIEANIIADSKSPMGHRITSMVVTFPRFILAEFNTHRMFSRNSASSRAIPFEKMLKMVEEDPFIPIAWQKDHKGMQGSEYFDSSELFSVEDFFKQVKELLGDTWQTPIFEYLQSVQDLRMSLKDWWLFARDRALESAIFLSCFGLTKQLCNRLLEPFMWHTVIITATEWENFFALRCPRYEYKDQVFRSRKDFIYNRKPGKHFSLNGVSSIDLESTIEDNLFWLKVNKGQAEIHMMALAEAMWDAYNESTPKELKDGEWHIPYGDNIDDSLLGKAIDSSGYYGDIEGYKEFITKGKIKIATARCARISYLNFEGKDDYEADIKLHDRLAESSHWSPFEHCARAMTREEYINHINGSIYITHSRYSETGITDHIAGYVKDGQLGWSGNFRGFIQYRKMFDNENIK